MHKNSLLEDEINQEPQMSLAVHLTVESKQLTLLILKCNVGPRGSLAILFNAKKAPLNRQKIM